LQAQHVDPTTAGQVAALPPVSTLFATFLGNNPIAHLLAPSGVLNTLPAQNVQTLTGNHFFPELVAGPFHHGLVIVFGAAAAMALVGALASVLRGSHHQAGSDRPTSTTTTLNPTALNPTTLNPTASNSTTSNSTEGQSSPCRTAPSW
jgi:hypothetical protein